MATYAIGDLQGCRSEFEAMLELLRFDRRQDRLWLVGDLVNRGPDSLGTLRLLYRMQDCVVAVLGNHDVHLLASAAGVKRPASYKDTLDEVLSAPDREPLLEWLRNRPLIYQDNKLGYVMVHAGLPPEWDLQTANQCAREVETLLRGSRHLDFMQNVYGDAPDHWNPELNGWDRARYILNCFTRLRYYTPDGGINVKEKSAPGTQPPGYVPWFQMPGRKSISQSILFGHWSTLRLAEENFHAYNVVPLDSGCVWGGSLTAMRLEDGCTYCVPAFRFHRRQGE